MSYAQPALTPSAAELAGPIPAFLARVQPGEMAPGRQGRALQA